MILFREILSSWGLPSAFRNRNGFNWTFFGIFIKQNPTQPHTIFHQKSPLASSSNPLVPPTKTQQPSRQRERDHLSRAPLIAIMNNLIRGSHVENEDRNWLYIYRARVCRKSRNDVGPWAVIGQPVARVTLASSEGLVFPGAAFLFDFHLSEGVADGRTSRRAMDGWMVRRWGWV